MKYAITGNKGLIGTFLKERMDREGHECVLEIDRREGFDVNDLLIDGFHPLESPEVFLHLAAQCRINEGIVNPDMPHKNNTDGIFAVLEYCRRNKIPKIVVASSSRVLSPERNPYVASKIYAEEMTKAYHDCYGLEYLIIRPSTVYGPCYDETSRLINNFITASFQNKELRIYGDRNKTLDFTYVDDFVDGVMIAMRGKWNTDYNISGENEVRLVDVANEVISQTGGIGDIVFLPPEKSQPQQVRVDSSKLRSLGYNPKINISEGIRRMIEWYKKHPDAILKYKDRGRQYYGK